VADLPPTAARLTLWGRIAGDSPLGWALVAVAAVVLTALLLLWLRPDVFVRVVFWLPAHLLYRIRVHGREHIPARGGVLFVCNHVSFLDAFLVFLAQRRPVRFIVWAPSLRVKGLRLLLRLARVLPIDSAAGPRAIIPSLRAAGDALKKGDVVCLFAEGAITRTGFLLNFHRGFEQVLKRAPAPVVPVSLDHVWGSLFSYRGGKFLWKWPQKLPYPVSVSFGRPLPPTATAAEVRQAIQKLSADAAIARGDQRLPVHRQFVRTAARHPFRVCFIDPVNQGKVWKYGQVLAGARLFSKLLRPILAEDRMVGVWLPPSAGGAFANIALTLLGKTPVNLNYTSSPQVVASAIHQCGIRHLLTARPFTSKVKLDPGPGVELVYLEDFRKEVSTAMRARAFLAVLLLPGFVLDRWVYGLARQHPDDLACVIFSSGSTGDPKGVMLSHRNIAANAESMIQAIDPRPSDRLLGVLPFFHCFGFTVTLWVPLMVGASMVFHADPRQAKEVGELCRTYRCTILLATPTFLRFYLKRCEPDDFKTLRVLMLGAEKMPPGLAQEFKDKFGVLPHEGYGCTELSPAAAANVADWEEGGARQVGNRPGTIGRPIPGVAARVVDPDTYEPLPAGKDGLLLVYGGNVMVGYLGRPEETHQVLRDGWYVTGDIARFDADGFLTITDRLARFSKIGGEMVPHQKIEDELHHIVGTSERTFVVTSVPDERRGERLVVLHTSLNGMDLHQVWQALNGKGLPNLWLPGERDFFPIPEVPQLGSGKLDLKQIKAIALERTRG
jgi:acyl-[acyl-carrier-protein]-phospholipid O-acyltransferase/long-chain-fatty-acid--[acyl-carrier-protein] ligase